MKPATATRTDYEEPFGHCDSCGFVLPDDNHKGICPECGEPAAIEYDEDIPAKQTEATARRNALIDSNTLDEPLITHTPAPWGVGDGQIHPKGRSLEMGCIVVFHPDGWAAMNPYATLHFENPEIAKANAAYIVRCVNSHDALVDALKAALPKCDFVIDRDLGTPCAAIAVWGSSFGRHLCDDHKRNGDWLMEIAEQCRAALAAAEVGGGLEADGKL